MINETILNHSYVERIEELKDENRRALETWRDLHDSLKEFLPPGAHVSWQRGRSGPQQGVVVRLSYRDGLVVRNDKTGAEYEIHIYDLLP